MARGLLHACFLDFISHFFILSLEVVLRLMSSRDLGCKMHYFSAWTKLMFNAIGDRQFSFS